MSGALQELTLTAFRGSSQTLKLAFEPKRTLSLIYGENGTGKTTICDAFEFLAADKLGSLEDRGMGGSLHKFWHSAGRQPGEMLVELRTAGGTCNGRIDGSKASISPSDNRPRVSLLRRKQVLTLVEAQPAQRYDAIKHFIEISGFERSEAALRDLVTSLGRELNEAAKSVSQSLATLANFHQQAGSSDGDAVVWARSELALSEQGRGAEVTKLATLRGTLATLQSYPEKVKAAEERVADAESRLAIARSVHQEASAAASADAAETIAVLEAGLSYLSAAPDPVTCPLCESAEAVVGLAARLQARLGTFRGLQATRNQLQRNEENLRRAKTSREALESEYRDMADRYQAAALAAASTVDVSALRGVPSSLAELEPWLLDMTATARSWEALETSWRERAGLLKALKGELETYDANRTQSGDLGRLKPLAEQALATCIAERQAFTTGIISDIAVEVGRLYEQVHPGEGLDKIALPLDPKRRASLDLRADFPSADNAPPQAYFSQSHLDTLGLCVFLALALRDRAQDTVLILDDVLGSVDEPHVDRVIEMIYEVSQRFRHTIVTTHYRPWREKYRWGQLRPDKPCHFVELTAWQLADGMRVTTTKPEVARLKGLLAEPDIDVQAACGKAGVLLEAMLDHLTLKYGCAVPRRLGEVYTVGDLLPAINGKLKAALRVEVRDGSADPVVINDVQLSPILDEIARLAQQRNLFGAHFKAIAMHMPEGDGVAFAKAVVALAEALIDPEHGWPGSDRSGSYWCNSGDTRRLHPLKKPS